MEQPNLSYIIKLSKGEISFQNDILKILNEELQDEINYYYNYFKLEDFKKVKVYVHRIKHKMSILGLNKSFEITNNFENDLRDLDFKHQEYFESILPIMINYLKTI